MNNNMFIPKQINVGFQSRQGTYTGKLAYIIYFDEKGVLRKEKSWNGWRDKNIENQIFDNVPTEGFVLNKKAGGYDTGWNHRQTYCRVYDPRGFEFEITIENLLYILENTNSIKGKGLEGEFIYAWSGKDLVLIPTSSPDYSELTKFNDIIHNNLTIKAKDLIVGATYLTKDNEELVYMGKFNYYGSGKVNGEWCSNINKGKHFWFSENKKGYSDYKYSIYEWKTMPKNKFISVVDEKPNELFAEMYEEMQTRTSFSPLDESKNEYIEYALDEFKKQFSWFDTLYRRSWSNLQVYNSDKIKYSIEALNEDLEHYNVYKRYTETYRDYYSGDIRNREKSDLYMESVTIEEIFNEIKPYYLNQYLGNNKLYESGRKYDE